MKELNSNKIKSTYFSSQKELVFIINSAYPNYAGGIENWLYNLSHRVCNNLKVTIVSIENREYPLLYNIENKKISYIKVKTLSSFKILKKIIRSYLIILDIEIASCLMGRKLRKHFSDPNVSYVIIALDTMYCVNAGLALKKQFLNCKLIASSRGPHAEIYGSNFPILQNYFLKFEKAMLSKVDQIWANGDDTVISLNEKGFQASLMLNGVDFEKFNKPCETFNLSFIQNSFPIVVNVSTLIPIKGIKELIDAADYIINKLNIKMNFVFIGKGDPSIYIDYTKSKNIFEYVHFLGHKSNVCEIIKSASIATCLSGGSGLSMAAIESLASGVPTIAWDTPVYRQFNKDNNYLKLVAHKDYTALALALVEVINNYEIYLNIANEAKEYARKFDWEVVTKSFLSKLFDNDSLSH